MLDNDPRLTLIRTWLTRDLGWRIGRISVASADASFRRYFRVSRGDVDPAAWAPKADTLIVMDAPPRKKRPLSVREDGGVVADALPRDEFDVARIAYGLATTGVITVRAPSRTPIEPHRSGAESLLASARALTRAGRHADAFGELRRAVQEDPLTPRVHLDFGCAAARIGDFASARASLEHVLRLTPDDAVGMRAREALDALNHLHRVLEAHVDD